MAFPLRVCVLAMLQALLTRRLLWEAFPIDAFGSELGSRGVRALQGRGRLACTRLHEARVASQEPKAAL